METTADRSSLAQTVGRFLHEMHRYDGGRTLPLMHKARITMPQLAVLEYVRSPRTPSAIAEHTGLSRPATSFMIDRLVRLGFVRRSEGVSDRRQRRVALSARGIALLDRIQAARVARFEATLGFLSTDAARCLEGALRAAMEELDAVRRSAQEGDSAA